MKLVVPETGSDEARDNAEASAADDVDAPVDVWNLQARRILCRVRVKGSGNIDEPLITEPTDTPGLYTTPNGILMSHYVNLAGYYEARGITVTPYEPVSPLSDESAPID